MSDLPSSTAALQRQHDDAKREIGEAMLTWLATVTPAMLEAGSQAMLDASTERVGMSMRLVPRLATEAQLVAAVWRAMLAAKLSEAVNRGQQS